MGIEVKGSTTRMALAKAVAILVEGVGAGKNEVPFVLSIDGPDDGIGFFGGSLEDIHRQILAECDYENGKWIYRGRKA